MIKTISFDLQTFDNDVNQYMEKNLNHELVTMIGPMLGGQDNKLLIQNQKPKLIVLAIFRVRKNDETV